MKLRILRRHISNSHFRPLTLAFLSALACVTCVSIHPQAATGGYRIAGQVINATTGSPVPRATVAALADEDNHIIATVQSDADGHFSIPNLPAAKYPLTASKRGYRNAFYDEHDDFNTAIVTGPGQDTGNLVFHLTLNSVLRGVVTGDGGDPVEGAQVMLFQHNLAQGDRMAQVETATTDDTGAYEFANLAAGQYLIAVQAQPWYAIHVALGAAARQKAATETNEALDVAYPITFFDSTIDEASASPITLAGGAREEANISLHATPALRLKVEAPRRADGNVARPELRQTVFGLTISSQSTGVMDAIQSGSTEFHGVAPGHYELTQGDPPRVVDLDASSNLEVDANSGTFAVNLTGLLHGSGGVPIAEDANVLLEPVDASHGQSPLQTLARKGQFHMDALTPGAWNLTAYVGNQTLPIVSVSAGGVTSAGAQIIVKDRPITIVATVSRAQTRILGFAKFAHKDTKGASSDAKGAPGVMILLVPRQPSAYRSLVRRDQSDSDGSFSLRDVPPGQYIVIAITEGWKLDWQRYDAIRRYLPGGVAVTINEHSSATVALPSPIEAQTR